LPGLASAQKLKKVKHKEEKQGYKEIFYVLKSDPTVKHGSYEKHGYKGKIVTTGFYKYGEKDSLWTEYGDWQNKIKASGNYTIGHKTGVWDFYN